jgi:hypothetical protein
MPDPIPRITSSSMNVVQAATNATKVGVVAKCSKLTRRTAARKQVAAPFRPVIFDSSDDDDDDIELQTTSRDMPNNVHGFESTTFQSPGMQNRSADCKLLKRTSFNNYAELAEQKKRPQSTPGSHATPPKRARASGRGGSISSAASSRANMSKVDMNTRLSEASIASNEKAISEGEKVASKIPFV